MNNISKENRIDACICLFNLVKEEVCREILEPLSRQVLLSPDSYVRSLMADALCLKDNSCCAITEEHLIDHLVTRFPALEVNKKIISQDDRCFIKKAVFRGREAVVKVMYVTNQNVRGRMPSDCQQANRRFIREAHFLSRIQKHPNFPILLSYNTETLPYHLITEYESQGNLLQLLQRTHDQQSRLEETLLLQMLINIADALQYLARLHLVHRSVMAKNVLVGDDNVCKLSGLHSLRPIDWGPLAEAEDVNDDLPLKWKAPECLMEYHYSTESDVWAFGVVMYEVLTLGCPPFGNLSDEDVYNHVTRGGTLLLEACFEDSENSLMKQCWEWKRSERISFPKLSSRLSKMNADLKTAGVARMKSRPYPHPLFAHVKVAAKREDDGSYTMIKESSRVVEKIRSEDELYHETLKKLSHQNISISILLKRCSPEIQIISMEGKFGNLKDYVLSGRKGGSCEKGALVTFLSQVASALDYLHTMHIVHGNLRAEHVIVESSNQVKVTRLGRSRRLSTRPNEETSKDCEESADMPPDATRWSAPEVISQGRYSHASDVWSFGVLAWELFAAFYDSNIMPRQTIPYYNHTNDEILQSIKKNQQLQKPLSCPDWIHFVIQECCSYEAKERPPAIALFDCLTCRNCKWNGPESPSLVAGKVQVVCLGQHKLLTVGAGEDTSKASVLQEDMPLDCARWSAPEVNFKGRYSHASDVWSFGVLAWELFAAFSSGENLPERTFPYHDLLDHVVGVSFVSNNLLQKPRSCPDWIDIIIRECLKYQAEERPPAIALYDCLTCRVPRQSWLIKLWIQNHNREEWPDLTICQPEDARHVLKEECRPQREDIEKMCQKGFD
ncbi:unnamed protein product [Pocillopora meandrina]|uniref:Protein kinase domain-containing protein n=1 Tax=Pocillopora meandrina TaxID=46732 RepID=A0AAU9XFR8_9CNID|nr:unnamed protein product [Pocillopora meandrina]